MPSLTISQRVARGTYLARVRVVSAMATAVIAYSYKAAALATELRACE